MEQTHLPGSALGTPAKPRGLGQGVVQPQESCVMLLEVDGERRAIEVGGGGGPLL